MTAGTAQRRTVAALAGFTREPGRSVLVEVFPEGAAPWRAGVAEDVARPAASLLKLPLALAVEAAFASGELDPGSLVAVERLVSRPGVLAVLHPGHQVSLAELLGLCLALSDNDAARHLLSLVELPAVRDAATRCGATQTTVRWDDGHPGGPLVGTTTASDALALLAAGSDARRHPTTAGALANSVHNSRIPLGVTAADVKVAHKTGTLTGVGHDVAVLRTGTGEVRLAFLSDSQHDTLVTGYDMGICTQEILAAWGMSVRSTKAIP